MKMYNPKFMKMAIDLSCRNIDEGGGPFGAVVVRNGEVVATGVNRVTAQNDPTAHAEVTAIRNAAQKLGIFDLSDCEIYTSCEPCPMCLGAIYWAHIRKIYYGNSKKDAAEIGFDDSFIYKELELAPENRQVKMERNMECEARAAFDYWNKKDDKTEY